MNNKSDKLKQNIEEYVTRYATKHKITKEEALKHKIVQEVIEWMKLRSKEYDK